MRAGRLVAAGREVPMASLHLAARPGAADPETAPGTESPGAKRLAAGEAASRGSADGLGLLVANCDLGLHRLLAPEGAFQRLLFDMAEQLRCESQAAPLLEGVPGNLQAAFDCWSQSMQAERLTENAVGLTLFSVVHMIRSRLVAAEHDPTVECLIESTRAGLLPLAGPALAGLRKAAPDQQAYARLALEIVEAAARYVGEALHAPAAQAALQRARLVVGGLDPSDLDTAGADGPAGTAGHASPDSLAASAAFGGPAAVEPLETLGGYRVFTREFDRVVASEDLVPEFRRSALRSRIDEQRRSAGVSTAVLARRLRIVLSRRVTDGWDFDAQEGRLDGARLARLAVDPAERRVFRQERAVPRADACVSFLVDTSGSMKRHGIEALAVLVDTMAQAVELAGASCEVLGFTTRSWAGGRARSEWHSSGAPPSPGRLAELCHIVYAAADTPWRRARRSISAMLSPHHYRESVYGEALIWAAARLAGRSESRRILVLVSDAEPTESATAGANSASFLNDHFAAVAHAVERRGGLELAVLSVGGDLSAVIARSAAADLDAPLKTCCDAVIGLLDPQRRTRVGA